jgi:hypothetical protein
LLVDGRDFETDVLLDRPFFYQLLFGPEDAVQAGE